MQLKNVAKNQAKLEYKIMEWKWAYAILSIHEKNKKLLVAKGKWSHTMLTSALLRRNIETDPNYKKLASCFKKPQQPELLCLWRTYESHY